MTDLPIGTLIEIVESEKEDCSPCAFHHIDGCTADSICVGRADGKHIHFEIVDAQGHDDEV